MTARHQAREAALQALYFWEVGSAPPDVAIEAVLDEHWPEASEAVKRFAGEIVHGTVLHMAELDALIAEHSQHWRLERLAVIDRLVLRLALWELLYAPETPPAVVLNEALELTRAFSTDDAVKFVNGVLDAIRQALDRRR